MESAIIAGTGIYEIPGFAFKEEKIETPYGPALVNIGTKDGFALAFLARHGLDHSTPPHKINFRANIKALQQLGVKNVLATFAVGSINRAIKPMELALVTDFLDTGIVTSAWFKSLRFQIRTFPSSLPVIN